MSCLLFILTNSVSFCSDFLSNDANPPLLKLPPPTLAQVDPIRSIDLSSRIASILLRSAQPQVRVRGCRGGIAVRSVSAERHDDVARYSSIVCAQRLCL